METKIEKCDMDHRDPDPWWEYDAQGIPLCKVCKYCRRERLGKYRPEILEGYGPEDVNEEIEPG